MAWLPPWWEARTKVTCDALTSVADASKPTLEESFQARTDIFISSDEDSKPIVSQRSEPQRNRYHRTEEQEFYLSLAIHLVIGIVRIRACSEIGYFTLCSARACSGLLGGTACHQLTAVQNSSPSSVTHSATCDSQFSIVVFALCLSFLKASDGSISSKDCLNCF